MSRTAFCCLILSLGLSKLTILPAHAQTLGTAFTYQGEVSQGGVPLDGVADFEFRLFTSQIIGVELGLVTVNDVDVTEGRFTVLLDFGPEFIGDARFLEIAVRSPAGSGSFTTLTPRQRLSATPYALHALASGKPWGTSSNGLNIIANNPGNVGIGTDAPNGALHIRRSFPDLIIQDEATSSQTGLVRYWDGNGNETGRLGFATSGSSNLSVTNNRAGGNILLQPGAGGRVGIGTAQPTAPLHIRDADPFLVLQDSSPASQQSGYVGFWDTAGVETGWMGYGTIGSPHMTIFNARSNGDITLDAGSGGDVNLIATPGGNINLDTTTGDVIIQNPFLGLGTSNPSFKLHAVASNTITTIYAQNTSINGDAIRGESPAGAGVYGVALNTTGTGVGVRGRSDSASGFDFLANGAGTNYGSTSSRRWKRNIEPIDDPLHMLAQLRGVYYDWDAEHGGHHDLGMIAEEVGAILPEIVNYEENGIDAIGMDYSKLTPLLVEAVKALQAEKDAEVAALRAENNRLRERLEAIERYLGQPSAERRNVDAP